MLASTETAVELNVFYDYWQIEIIFESNSIGVSPCFFSWKDDRRFNPEFSLSSFSQAIMGTSVVSIPIVFLPHVISFNVPMHPFYRSSDVSTLSVKTYPPSLFKGREDGRPYFSLGLERLKILHRRMTKQTFSPSRT